MAKSFSKFIRSNKKTILWLLAVSVIAAIGYFGMIYIVVLGITAEPRPDNEVFHKSVGSFESRIGMKIPDDIKKDDIQCYGHNNWMGDGVVECSFVTNSQYIQKILEDKPNGNGWLQGPYGQETCIAGDDCNLVNRYTGANEDIKLLNGDNIFYSFKSRSKVDGYPYANFDLYVVDVDTNTVMIIESDS